MLTETDNHATAQSRASVSTKIVLIIAMFSLPISVLAYLLAANFTPQIQTAQLELRGNSLQRSLSQVLHGLVESRNLVENCGSGDCAARVATATDAVRDSFAALVRENTLHAEQLKTSAEELARARNPELAPARLQAEWNALVAEAKGAADERVRSSQADRQDRLIAQVRQLMGYVGDSSTLVLDPDLDSYYLVDATSMTMPDGLIRIAGSHALAARLIASGRSEAAEVSLANEVRFLNADLKRIAASTRTSLEADAGIHGASPTLATKIGPALQNYQTVLAAYLQTLEQVRVNPKDVTADDLAEKARQANNAGFDYWSVAGRELDALLQKRVDDLQTSRVEALGFSGLAVLVAALLAFLIGRSITKPLESLVRNLGPGATLLGVSVNRIAESSQSRTPNPDEAAIICEELSAHADNMRKAVLELAKHVEGSGSNRLAMQSAEELKV